MIDTEHTTNWLTIYLNTPENRNALSREMVTHLSQALDAAEQDASLRGITIRGKGPAFCAGGDLKGFAKELHSESRASIVEVSRHTGALFHRINRMPMVVVMCVHGAAIAGGIGVMAAGDVVIVQRDTRFALTETRLGIVPAQIAPLVVQRIGLAASRRLMLTGARFDGVQAGQLGLADFVVDTPAEMDAVESAVRKDVLQCASGANAATKKLLQTLDSKDPGEIIDRAATVFSERLHSDEGREGIEAFLDKRRPRWSL